MHTDARIINKVHADIETIGDVTETQNVHHAAEGIDNLNMYALSSILSMHTIANPIYTDMQLPCIAIDDIHATTDTVDNVYTDD